MNTADIADALDGLELFQSFSYGELKILGRYLVRESRQAGEVIFREGDPGSFMLILTDGRVSVYKGGDDRAHLLSCEARGRFIGEMALIDHEPRSATCTADTACTFFVLDHAALDALANEAPLLAFRFMRCLALLLSRRLRRTSGRLIDTLTA